VIEFLNAIAEGTEEHVERSEALLTINDGETRPLVGVEDDNAPEKVVVVIAGMKCAIDISEELNDLLLLPDEVPLEVGNHIEGREQLVGRDRFGLLNRNAHVTSPRSSRALRERSAGLPVADSRRIARSNER
jgi:hypothetical protein